jgi:hypothetical protein
MRDNIGVYIPCSDYCGLRIYDGDQDHAAGCGAPPEEKARILRDLGTAKIKAASAEEEPAAEVTWRCSCGEEFPSQDDLAGHHTESGHQGMWMVDADGNETEDGFDATVDGQPAKVKRGPAREQIQVNTEKYIWHEPEILPEWVFTAQKAIDDGKVIVGGLGAGKKCSGRQVIDGYEMECIHQPMMRSLEVIECDAHKKHSSTLQQLCLIHWIRLLGADLVPVGLGPLLDGIA